MSEAAEDLPKEAWRTISIVRLKQFVADRLPHNWILRDVILSERDGLTPAELSAKSETWLKILRKAEDARS